MHKFKSSKKCVVAILISIFTLKFVSRVLFSSCVRIGMHCPFYGVSRPTFVRILVDDFWTRPL